MSKKKLPTWLESLLVPEGAAIDYGEYAGAGFPPAQSITDSKAQELRRDAAEILAAEYLQTKEPLAKLLVHAEFFILRGNKS